MDERRDADRRVDEKRENALSIKVEAGHAR